MRTKNTTVGKVPVLSISIAFKNWIRPLWIKCWRADRRGTKNRSNFSSKVASSSVVYSRRVFRDLVDRAFSEVCSRKEHAHDRSRTFSIPISFLSTYADCAGSTVPCCSINRRVYFTRTFYIERTCSRLRANAKAVRFFFFVSRTMSIPHTLSCCSSESKAVPGIVR